MFEPDYRNIVNSARNIEAERLPLYEHNVDFGKIGEIMGVDLPSLYKGDEKDIHEFFRVYSKFFKDYGYDVVTFECCIGECMPGSGALGDSRVTPVIQEEDDFNSYPWEEIPDYYFEKYSKYFRALRDEMPEGMKAIGGVGNGIFECVQDLTSFQGLCYIKADDEELYENLFRKVGETNLKIWERFMKEFGDIYCVLRFGDDLGYKSSTMLSPTDVPILLIMQFQIMFTDHTGILEIWTAILTTAAFLHIIIRHILHPEEWIILTGICGHPILFHVITGKTAVL